MTAARTWLVMFLFLSGCGGCQRDEAPQAGNPAKAPAAAGGAPERAAPTAPGKIQVAPVQPTLAVRQAPAAQPPGDRGGAAPDAGAPAAPPVAGVPDAHDEGDCIVIGDANPDYGPPPLAVAFSAEAECSAGQATYKWDFGDGSPPSNEVNPSHTYTKAGDYTVSVTATAGGATASDEIEITVEEGEAEPQ